MAIQYKDYYEILGVSKSATEDDIRRAFRKLARVYHPDKNGGNSGAEDKFKEINEAYEVLGDPQKRQKYDEFGEKWLRNDGSWDFPDPSSFEQPNRPGNFTFHGTGFSDFFDQLFNQTNGTTNRTTRETQKSYHRERIRPEPQEIEPEPIPGLKGEDLEADILVTLEEVFRGAVRPITVKRSILCQTCFGVGNFNGHRCHYCEGTGRSHEGSMCKVKIPKGIREGTLLRIAGQGEENPAGGPPGDLYLKVRFAGHPEFRVIGGILQYEAELAPWEAVLGSNVILPLLDGTKVSIKIPAGTQAGHKLRVRGRGLPSMDGTSGDLMVEIKLQVPREISEREKGLWSELARSSDYAARDYNN